MEYEHACSVPGAQWCVNEYVEAVVHYHTVLSSLLEDVDDVGEEAISSEYETAAAAFQNSTFTEYPYVQPWSTPKQVDYFWIQFGWTRRRGCPDVSFE